MLHRKEQIVSRGNVALRHKDGIDAATAQRDGQYNLRRLYNAATAQRDEQYNLRRLYNAATAQ